MPINKFEKQELLDKLNALLKKQSDFQQEINRLELQITRLQVEDQNQKNKVSGSASKEKLNVKITEPAKAKIMATTKALFAVILPDGIGRFFVRGIFASISLSCQ